MDSSLFLFAGVMSLGLMLSAILSINTYADDVTDVVDTVNIDIPSACTMGGNIATGQEHNATVTPNTYQNNIGKTTITTTCNDSGGYAIYAIGFTGNQYEGADHTKLIGSTTNQKISTGTAKSGSSQWAMRVTAVSGTYAPTIENSFDSSNYHIVPDTYTKVASYSSATDTGINATGSSIETTYAVYIAGTQPSDTYTGKVKYTLVHPSTEVPLQPQTTTAGQICYYPNGNGVVGSMGCQTVSTSATNATLLASNFSREGYGFAGWSTTFDYSDSTGFYGPQETITFDAGTYTGSNPGLSLYARWIKSADNLQGWTGCSSLATGAVTALTDQRDNDTYAVAKLADGNCWMIENLRLDNTNSDNSTGTLSQGYATGFIGLADPEAPWADDSIANSLYSTDGSTAATISGNGLGDRFPRYNGVNTPSSASDRPQNPTANDATNSTSNAGMYSYGNYYTWAAAAADFSETWNIGDYNTKSICPTGWSIPRGGDKSRESTNDFWTYIVTNLNGGTNPANYDSSNTPYYTGKAEAGPVANALRAYPNNFVYSGFINNNLVRNSGSSGYYWSSTAQYIIAHRLILSGNSVYPGTSSNGKSDGASVRCFTSGA